MTTSNPIRAGSQWTAGASIEVSIGFRGDKDQAFKLGIPYQTLMRMWISIGIHQTQARIRIDR